MTGAPNQLTETPDPQERTIRDILASMRLSGGVVIDTKLRGDFSLASAFVPEECAQFFPVTGPLIGYHFVRSGELSAEVEGQPARHASAGSFIVTPRNDRHRLFNADVPTSLASDHVEMPDTPGGMVRLRLGEEGETVELWCGFLSTDGEDSLLQTLPPLLVVDAASALQREWVSSSFRFAAEGIGSAGPQEVAKLAEITLRDVLFRHLRQSASEAPQWLAGLRDRVVARALAIIHDRFSENLEVEAIAREVGVSRAVLAERFTSILGEPPMRYCARWRMRVAANLLRDQASTNAAVAYAVGFNSEAAFNRAFKREYGEPPAAWRKRKLGQMREARAFSPAA